EVPDDAPIELDLTLEAVEGGIVVAGTIGATWIGECRRCLGAVRGDLTASVEEIYVREPEEGETYPIDGDHIDLEPLAREAVVLALPLAPLCRPDCQGLCPTCGADRNDGPCACPAEEGDPRWAALDALREKS
ncbi:MAG: YceD family protein, partial [Acidimicrobiales bacterium]